MRDKIKEIVRKTLRGWNLFEKDWEIHFGYDCIGISILRKDWELYPEDIIALGHSLKTDVRWINSEDGNLVIGYDITKFIVDEFGGFKEYNIWFESLNE
mgnify:CR=1 FL=1